MPGSSAPVAAPLPPQPAPPAWQVVAGTAVGCLLLGALTNALSEAPLDVAPLNPTAGLALGTMLAFGAVAASGGVTGVAVGVIVGAALLSLAGLVWAPLAAGLSMQQQLAIACGVAFQALAGAVLVKRFAPQPLTLNTPRAILYSGLLAGLLAPTISASAGTLSRWLGGNLAVEQLVGLWSMNWLADATGVLLVAPVVLSFFGQPAADWRPRRRSVAVPLLLALGLLAVSTWAFERLQAQRAMATFERDATRLAHAAEARLLAPVLALRALHSAVATNPQLDAQRLQQATAWWLAQPYQVQAMGVAHLRPGEAGPAAAAAPNSHATPAADEQKLVVQQVAPLPASNALLGLDVLSVPAARPAALATRSSGEPAASPGFNLAGQPVDDTTAVLYLAIYDGQPKDAAARQQQFRGAVFLTLSVQRALTGLREPDLKHMSWCLLDAGAAFDHRRHLAGPLGCENLPEPGRGQLHQVRSLMLANRPVELHIACDADRLPGGLSRARWVVPGLGLLASALLGALLLTITGHSRRTERAVLERTAQLRLEMAERAQAQEALHASEDRMRAILDNLPLGIAFMDAQGLLLECNPHLCNMLGRSTERLRGESVVSCFDPSEEQRIRGLRSRLISQRETVDSVDSIKLRAASGRLTDVRVVASALWNSDGRMAHVVAAIQDMTAHHQLQQSELALNRAESASRAKSEFVSRMSHELRTPLNAMIGFAQLLALNGQPKLAPRQLEWTQQIQRAGWHLLAMINDTLDLARIESGATRLSLEAVELAPLLTACGDWVQEAAAQRGVKLQMNVARDVPAVLADSTRLKQILTNLLSNAVKYNREGGSVDIRVRVSEPRMVDILVSDTGMGMTAEQVSSLFQPYNRLGRENTTIEGSGIGLVISRLLAELMGGTLQSQSVPGEGSVFTLSLPATQRPGTAEPLPAQPERARYQQRLVHYVEDNATNVEVMRGVLMQRSQITLQTSTLGLDGLSAIRHSRPDLILLDMQLPDISGLELLRHIKRDDQIASIPVIVVSADATPQNMERALTLGAKHYVTKPLDVASFLGMVDKVLDENLSMPPM